VWLNCIAVGVWLNYIAVGVWLNYITLAGISTLLLCIVLCYMQGLYFGTLHCIVVHRIE